MFIPMQISLKVFRFLENVELELQELNETEQVYALY